MIRNDFEFQNHPAGQQVIENAKRLKTDQYILFMSSHLHVDYSKVKHMCEKMKIQIPLRHIDVFQELNLIFFDICRKHKTKIYLHELFSFVTGLTVIPLCLLYRIFNPFCITNTILLICFFTYYGFNVFHMRHHKGFLWNKRLYDIVCPVFDIIDNIFMRETTQWVNNHNLSHHIYTNLNDDYDYFSKYPIIRYDIAQPKLWFHNYQHIYVFMLYAIGETVRLLDKLKLRGRPTKIIVKNYICFLLHYVIMIGLPCIYIPLRTSIIIYILTYIPGSLLNSLLFQISHNHVKYNHIVDKTIKIQSFDHWVELQLKESISWGGILACIMFGGINYQSEHHLAPACSPIALHYFHLYLIQHNKHYNYVPTFTDACRNLYLNQKKV